VAGSPIAHSLSPVLHRAAYAELGLDWTYDLIECDEAGLPGLVASLAATPEFVGMSLTMPLKSKAYQLADHRAPSAVHVGVANTLLMAGGRTTAHNTDVGGVVFALHELGVEHPPVAPAVLGGGGTARAALAALARIGSTTAEVAVRRPEAGRTLVELGAGLGIDVTVTGWPTSCEGLSAADLVIATTPAGATDGLAATGWRGDLPLLDVLYAPWPTGLATAALGAGAPVVGGLSMLVGQAVEAVELMTGSPAPVAAMRAAGEAALQARTKQA
jgi:shikimate dehydrogenase